MAWWTILIAFSPIEIVAKLTSRVYVLYLSCWTNWYPAIYHLNRTSSPVITAPPLMTGTTNGNWNCPPCAINADAAPDGGLQQVLWYTESISLTLDTVSIYVTRYNGSNATAITRYFTIYGDVSTLNVSNISAAQ